MAKEIFYGEESFKKILSGVNKLSDAIAVTMGARGRNVLIEKENGMDAHITKDGVTVAKAIDLKDPVEALAANLVKRVSISTNNKVGDGSSSSAILAASILNNADSMTVKGHNPVQLKKGIDKELKEVLAYIDSLTEDISDDMDKVYNIALISANGDEEIAKVVTEIYKEIGKDGNVAIEGNSNSLDLTYEKVEGVEFNRGYNNPYFMTDLAKQIVSYEDVEILISDRDIKDIYQIKSVLERVDRTRKPLLIIAGDIDPQVDAVIAVNKMQRGIPVATVNAPEFGDRRLNFLEDLAVITGGSFISDVTGKSFDDITEEDFGKADKIVVTSETTTIIGGRGNKEKIEERFEGIRKQIELETSEENKKYLNTKLAKLQGGVVILRVGGASDVERLERKDRVEDAVNAAKAALKGGVIPGGGIVLKRISRLGFSRDTNDSDSVFAGRKLLRDAISKPFYQILFNAGHSDEEIEAIADTIIKSEDLNRVYNVNTEEFEDCMESGVIDPALVIKTGLANAVSVAGTLLTSACTIVYEQDETNELSF